MAVLYAPIEVGAKIMEWYSCIISRDIEQAEELKVNIQPMLKRMEQDDKIVAYFQLVKLRHDMLIESFDKKELRLQEVNEVEIDSDRYLRFMYYFISGQNEYHHARYKSAIRSFKVAERLVEDVNDKVEKAEFYQKLGYSYYYIDQFTFSASYIEMALEFFEKDDTYLDLELNSKLILAAIDTEMERYKEADGLYDEILVKSKPFPATYGMAHYNQGLNRVSQQKTEEAKKCFKNALDIKEHAESIYGVKTRFELALIELRMDSYQGDFSTIQEDVEHYNLIDYRAKSKIIDGLYLSNNEELITEGIQDLIELKLYFDCNEMSQLLASYYEERCNFGKSSGYLKLALRMQKLQQQLGVDQT